MTRTCRQPASVVTLLLACAVLVSPHELHAQTASLAKLSVSALLFDYVLTGPISSVSAGQYIVGLGLEVIARITDAPIDEATKSALKSPAVVAYELITSVHDHLWRVGPFGGKP